MSRKPATPLAVTIVTFVLLACAYSKAGATEQLDTTPIVIPANIRAETAAVAADRFLASLDAAGRKAVMLPLDSPKKSTWSNLPRGLLRDAPNGIRLGDLSDDQRTALLSFLGAALSPYGADLVEGIVTAEGVLGNSPRASYFQWSADNYWLAFFGEPSDENDWNWQFSGHHLAINMAYRDGVQSMSPTFIGVEPANFELNGSPASPLQDRVSHALALMASLPDAIRASSIVGTRPRDVLAGEGQDGAIPEIEGSRVVDWSEANKTRLLDLITLWIGIMPVEAAEQRLGELRKQLDQLRFSWHGPYDGTGSIYYRIQGPDLILEFSTEGAVGSNAGHYHSIYRNPENEYGGD